MKSNKAFYPISLGNHYYTNNVLTGIKDRVSINFQENMLVICDHLRYLSYKMRGIDTDIIEKKIVNEVSQFQKTLKNCGYDSSRITIENMSSLICSEIYLKIERGIFKLIKDEEQVFDYLNELSMFTLDKFEGSEIRNNIDVQIQYFVSETAMSIYVTECLGFENEYYKQFDRGLVVIVYEKYNNYLKRILGTDVLSRKFYSLKDILL